MIVKEEPTLSRFVSIQHCEFALNWNLADGFCYIGGATAVTEAESISSKVGVDLLVTVLEIELLIRPLYLQSRSI